MTADFSKVKELIENYIENHRFFDAKEALINY